MDIVESRIVAAPVEVVWAALFSPEVLKACIPGCEELTGNPDEGFSVVVVQKVGPVKARFSGRVSLTERVEGRSVLLSGEGSGGVAGFAKGAARVLFEPVSEGCRISYTVEAHVGGKLAQLGSRVIEGVARRLADEFFARLQTAVESPAAETTSNGQLNGQDESGHRGRTRTGVEESEEAASRPAEKPRGWFRRLIGKT